MIAVGVSRAGPVVVVGLGTDLVELGCAQLTAWPRGVTFFGPFPDRTLDMVFPGGFLEGIRVVPVALLRGFI